jgi:hypothetical protein
VGRIERGQRASVGLVELGELLATVGLRLVAQAVPDGTAYRDAGQHRVLEAIRRCVRGDAPWRAEVPFPNAGDRRSWDAVTRSGGLRVGIEAETRPRDGQELQRRLNQKRRDGGVDRLLLVLPDTRSNRRFLADHGDSLAVDYPTSQLDALRALAEDGDPGDAIILIGLPRDP